MLYHLFIDQIYNVYCVEPYNLKNVAYFLFYRIKCKFDLSLMRKKTPEMIKKYINQNKLKK